jgi:hypothetical protein
MLRKDQGRRGETSKWISGDAVLAVLAGGRCRCIVIRWDRAIPRTLTLDGTVEACSSPSGPLGLEPCFGARQIYDDGISLLASVARVVPPSDFTSNL